MTLSPVAVFLCSKTGQMARPWAEAGYLCLCYDLQHRIRVEDLVPEGAGQTVFLWGDVRSLTLEQIREDARRLGGGEIRFWAAFPPCTHLAVAGARDFAKKGLRLLIDALEIVEACRVLMANSGKPWMLEQPVSRLASLWRAPDAYIQPWEYGAYLLPFDEIPWKEGDEHYTKKTSLWYGGGFVVPSPKVPPELVGVEPDDRIHKASPGAGRGDLRSVTPLGFARAVFCANSHFTHFPVAA